MQAVLHAYILRSQSHFPNSRYAPTYQLNKVFCGLGTIQLTVFLTAKAAVTAAAMETARHGNKVK